MRGTKTGDHNALARARGRPYESAFARSSKTLFFLVGATLVVARVPVMNAFGSIGAGDHNAPARTLGRSYGHRRLPYRP